MHLALTKQKELSSRQGHFSPSRSQNRTWKYTLLFLFYHPLTPISSDKRIHFL